MNKFSLNQIAWVKLFETHNVLEKINKYGSAALSAAQIKMVREPRLMTKFDHSYQLPPIFSENNISILPTSRGTYELGRFEIFHKWSNEPNSDLVQIDFPTHFESLDFDNITSESIAISCAFVAKIFEDFLEQEVTPTISGRMSSNKFDFTINNSGLNHQIIVDRAQIEIDGGFESADFLALIEAKNYLVDDFVIRQLYYPYRKWKNSISKNIRNIFLTYSNGIFELREYEFSDLFKYNSINLIKCKRYAACSFSINIQSIQQILNSTATEEDPCGIPFPQADSFDRLINLCELLAQDQFLTKDDITDNYGFDKRQTDYYTNACKYLGFIRNSNQGFVLTEIATHIFKQHIQLRRKFFIEQLMRKRVFRQSFIQYLKNAEIPERNQIIKIMKNNGCLMSESTYNRRASTVIAWINWIVEQIEI